MPNWKNLYLAMHEAAQIADYFTPGSNYSFIQIAKDSITPLFITDFARETECLARERITKHAAFL